MIKKLAFINSTLSLGGAEKMAYEVIRGLDKTGFHIKAYCLYRPGFIGRALMAEGIDFSHTLMRNKYDIAGIYRLFTLLRKERPDILYLENSPLVLFWGFICGRMLDILHIVTVFHTMRKPVWWRRLKSDFVNRLILRRLDRIGVVSKVKLDSLIKEYRLDPARVELINNAVDIDRFKSSIDKNALREAIGFSEDEKIIGMVGRLVTEKAYDVFLKSAKLIAEHVPNSKFLIIGEGEERANLERLTKDLGLEKRVIFLGERSDAADLISLFDVAVLSSRIESFPLVLLEYMAASRPIVATGAGGNPEIISDGYSGLIVPPEEPDRIACAVIDLINNPEKTRDLGTTAGRIAEEKFSLPHLMGKMERFFSSGAAYHILMTGPSLDSKGGISSFAKNYLSSEFPQGFKLIYHPTTKDGNKISKLFFFIKSLVLFFIRLVTDRRIKIVHICSASRGSFYRKAIVLSVSRSFRKSTIFHIHGAGFDVFYNTSHPLRRFCIRWVLDFSDEIIVLSKRWHSVVSKMTRNTNIKIIPNPIDVSDFRHIRQRRDFSGLNIFTAGRLERRKGTYDILDIAPAVLREMPGVRFYLAGDGDVEKIRGLCRKKGIEESMILLGWLDRAGLVSELERASVFLLPSYHEGLPIAILEAMASGLPVISTKVGGIPEMIEDGVNGFLVTPGKKEELSKRLVELLGNTKLKETMARNNIEKIDSMFRLDRVVSRFFAEYRDLLQHRGKV